MRKISAIFFLVFGCQLAMALEVNCLKVNNVANPQCIDSKSPKFSWIMSSDDYDVHQTSYQLSLYADSLFSELIYDSGNINSTQTVDVEVENLALEPSTRYYWRVTVSDNHGNSASSNEYAYFDTGLMDEGWSGAMWIKGESGVGTPYFRKTFTIEGNVKTAKLYATSLGVYTAYINGLKPYTLNHKGDKEYSLLNPGNEEFNKRIFYNGYDVTSLVKIGENVIGAFVASGWWNGKVARGKYGNKDNAFLCKLVIEYENGTKQTIVTDKSWHYSKNQALQSSDMYDGEIYDATKESNWQTADFDYSDWDNVLESNDFEGIIESYKGPVVKGWENLSLHPSATIYEGIKETGSDYGVINAISNASSAGHLTVESGQTALFDFGQNHSGLVNFKLKADSGTVVHIQYAEMLNDDGSLSRGNDGPGGSLYRANYRTAKAESYYTSKGDKGWISYCPQATFYGYRYCSITATSKIELDSVVSIPVSSSEALGGNVSTNNESVNRLFQNAVWGQRSNYLSIPMDCPQRDEKLGWCADTQIFSRTGMYNDDVKSFFHKWMVDLRDNQFEDGAFPSTAPTIYNQKAAGWADAGIIIPWNVYVMYGDTAIIEENYEAMSKYMDWLSNQHDGEIVYAGANAVFGDWLAFAETDKRYVSMAYYAWDAQIMAKMSKIIEKKDVEYKDKSVAYIELFKRIRDEIQEVYFESGVPKENSQTSYILALAFNLYKDETQKILLTEGLQRLIKENNETLNTGFIGTYLLNPTLSECNLNDEAYTLLLQHNYPSWLYSVDQGATTTWERWNSYTKENGFGDKGMNSFNHYAYGAVGEWMYRCMLGIEVDEDSPGFKNILLRPCPDMRDSQDRISKADGYYDSQYGRIESSWDKVNGNFTYRCVIPANTTATLMIPVVDETKVLSVNGSLEEKGLGYELISKSNSVWTYALKSGRYVVSSSFTDGIESIPQESMIITPLVIGRQVHFLDSSKKNINLYDFAGKLLHIYTEVEECLDLSSCGDGLYFIKDTVSGNCVKVLLK